MTDQQRWDWVGGGVGSPFETPNLDRLAAAGVTFERAYSGASTCVPARNALLTGLQQHHLDRPDGTHLAEGAWTIAHALRAAGWETALIGRMHFRPLRAEHGFETNRRCEVVTGMSGYAADEVDDYGAWVLERAGYDPRRTMPTPDGGRRAKLAGEASRFPLPAELHPTTWIVDEAERFLAERSDDRPLFLVVSFPHPHGPYDPPEPFASLVHPDQVDLPDEDFSVNAGLPEVWQMELLRGQRFSVERTGERRVRTILATIAGLVRQIDDGLGRLLDSLDLARTVVWFTSDHGDFGGHRGLYNKVPWIPFEDLLRVPLVIAGAGAAAGVRCDVPVQTQDLPLTCLDWAGIDPPADAFRSRSIRALVEGGDDPAGSDRPLFASVGGWGYATVIRGHDKLITRSEGEHLLFDLATDPGERRPRQDEADARPVVRELSALLDEQWARGVADLPRFDPPRR